MLYSWAVVETLHLTGSVVPQRIWPSGMRTGPQHGPFYRIRLGIVPVSAAGLHAALRLASCLISDVRCHQRPMDTSLRDSKTKTSSLDGIQVQSMNLSIVHAQCPLLSGPRHRDLHWEWELDRTMCLIRLSN